MFRKGITLVVMLLFVGMSVIPSLGNVVEDSGISLITIKVIGNREENGWYLGDVPITITSESNEIAEIHYKIGSGSWYEYTEPFNISVDGDDIPLVWYAVDFEGNQSEVDGPYLFDIDQTVPDIEEVVWEAFEDPSGSGHWYVKFTCDAVDETSGMDRVEFYINDGLHEVIVGSGPIYEFTIEFQYCTFWFVHYDVAGNWIEDDIPGYISPSGLESSLFSTGVVEEDNHQYNQKIAITTEIVEREKTQFDCSISEDFDPSYIVIDVNREKGDNDWIISDVKINMIPDPDDIIAVYYQLDGGNWTPYNEPYSISDDGIYSFSWYVIDLEGQSSTPDSMYFKIDKTLPEITLTKERISIGKVNFTANVYDETSNIERVEFRGDEYLYFTDYDFPYECQIKIWDIVQIGNKVNVTVFDNAGNRNSSFMNALSIPSYIITKILFYGIWIIFLGFMWLINIF